MSWMPRRFFAIFLALLVPVAQAQAPAAGAADAEPIVDLPDFTRLVERAGPAVVNIEASMGGGEREVAQGPSPRGQEDMPDDMPEFFKRFFEQQPGMPRPTPRGGVSQGTGFIISADGYVLTCQSVPLGDGVAVDYDA